MPPFGQGLFGQGEFGVGLALPPSPLGIQMQTWLPEMWYDRSVAVKALLNAEGRVLDQAAADVALVEAARLPQTAPTWGLTRFEDETNLDPRPDQSDAERAARILGHFRGIGSTIARLQTIASSWGQGSVAIMPDPEGQTIYVAFNDIRGLPDNIADHQAEFRANVQAHLNIVWLPRYLTWAELMTSGKTWQHLIDVALTWDELTTWSPA